MGDRLQNLVCLISGSTGIAAATAQRAQSEGGRVFFTSRSEEHCAELAEKLGGRCGWKAADLRSADEVDAVVASCVERYERIDTLFNVAGISGRRYGDGPIHECTEEGWDITMDSNLKSMFLMCRAVIGQMLRQEARSRKCRGSVLNMTSVLASSPEGRMFATHAYTASKGAIDAMSRAMASHYAPRGIRVNAIAPGVVRTPMSKRAQSDSDVLGFLKTKQPLGGTLIDPEEVADAAVFLLSDEARQITGEVLTVDGGWSVTG